METLKQQERLSIRFTPFLSSPDVFGRNYSGSSKAKQMKRKRGAMLHSTIKYKVLKHNMQTKYNRL